MFKDKNGNTNMFNFDHKQFDLLHAMSISQERAKEIGKFITDRMQKRHSKVSMVIQEIFNTEAFNEREKLYMLYSLGRFTSDTQNPIPLLIAQAMGFMFRDMVKAVLEDKRARKHFVDFVDYALTYELKKKTKGGEQK